MDYFQFKEGHRCRSRMKDDLAFSFSLRFLKKASPFLKQELAQLRNLSFENTDFHRIHVRTPESWKTSDQHLY